MMYALCSFVAGYYWNIIWLDALALLPLMLAGMVSLLREGRFRLYTLALALSLLCNYYLSFFCCIFVGLSFFVWCICRWDGWKRFSAASAASRCARCSASAWQPFCCCRRSTACRTPTPPGTRRRSCWR